MEKETNTTIYCQDCGAVCNQQVLPIPPGTTRSDSFMPLGMSVPVEAFKKDGSPRMYKKVRCPNYKGSFIQFWAARHHLAQDIEIEDDKDQDE